VYGQNSASNLDPDDADVVGVVERGWVKITGTTDYYDEVTTTIPAFKAV
jgi:hypothetical protein